MELISIWGDYSLWLLVGLSVCAFVAGFIDSVVGGGGLIQVPALLIGFPDKPVATLFGTNKIAALSGTSVAAWQYSRRIEFDYRFLVTVAVFAFAASICGARLVSMVRAEVLKPVILVVLIVMAVYIYTKKSLGTVQTKSLPLKRKLLLGALVGGVVGFYDGFFGPGTGSFLILGFVVLIGFEFVTASAYAKVINCLANFSALIVFVSEGHFMLDIGLLLAAMNIAGNIVGSRMAMRKGNGFVRKVFLLVVSLLIIRYGYDIVTAFYLQ